MNIHNVESVRFTNMRPFAIAGARTGYLAAIALVAAIAAPGVAFAEERNASASEDQTSAFDRPARQTTSAEGEVIYGQRCAVCHDHAHDRIPLRIVIERKSPEGVIAALTTGPMRPMAEGLSESDKKNVAIYLTGKPLGQEPSATANSCLLSAAAVKLSPSDWSSWGGSPRNTLFQPNPGLDAHDVPKLKLKWAFAYPGGTAGAEPIAVGGRLFLTTGTGLFALDAKTGCTYWHSGAAAGAKMVTAAVTPSSQGRVRLFYGDPKAEVSAVDGDTGKVLWTTKIDEHASGRVTGPVTVYGDRVYAPVSSMEDPLSHDPAYPCCTFRGSVVALDAATGKQLWKSYSITVAPQPLGRKSSAGAQLYGPAGGAIYAPLTIDGKRKVIYAATAESYQHDRTDGDNAIIAYDLDTGTRKWAQQPRPLDNAAACKFQDEEDGCDNPASPLFEFASPVVMATLADGKDILLAGQKSGAVYAFDPDQEGKLLWETRVGQGGSMGGVELGFATAQGVAYVPVSDSEVKSPHVPGGLVALDIANGKVLWRTPAPKVNCSWGAYACNSAQAGSPAAIPGIVFSGSWDGHMRAYATASGAIVWDVDTAKSVMAVNKVTAVGGAISGYPVIVTDGMVYVTSGAASMTHPGNALLAYSVDGL
jgi:polyvinyl alcohol dehydrogenase (cytochrome)